MEKTEAARSSSRLEVPGYARDARQRTYLPAELPFFNDAAMAARLIAAGVDPILAHIPRSARIADFGGADGFVAQQVRQHLSGNGIDATGLVVDANVASLEVAQRRGLAIVPCNLEHARLSPVHLVVMRLVLQYNGLAAQKRILRRAFECLAPGGYLVLQAESGTRASAVFRNLLAAVLQRGGGSVGARGTSCRWLSNRALAGFVRRCGYELTRSLDDFLTFEMRLDDLLLLAWTRFHGTPTSSDVSLAQYHAFCDYAHRLATRMLQRRADAGLRVDSTGTIQFTSRHALILARRPGVIGAPHAAANGSTIGEAV